jgi:hypothetical protein
VQDRQRLVPVREGEAFPGNSGVVRDGVVELADDLATCQAAQLVNDRVVFGSYAGNATVLASSDSAMRQ